MVQFRRLRGGIDPITDGQWNLLTETVEKLANLKVAPPLELLQSRNAMILRLMGKLGENWFLAKITNAGPAAEADPTDEKYWIREQEITSTATDDLTLSNLTGGRWALATNLNELVSVDHDLPVDGTIKVIVFQIGDAANVIRYVFMGPAVGSTTDAEVVDPVPEGTETADTGTWSKASPPANTDGVKLKVHTRSVYNNAGDELLYGFYRELTFDSLGLLTAISAETRYIIETPGACP